MINQAMNHWPKTCSTFQFLYPFIFVVFQRKPGPEYSGTTSPIPTNQGPLHPSSSLGMVQTRFYESGVVWMFHR